MVHQLARAEVTQSRIAETLGMSDRTVRRILQEEKPREVDDGDFRKSRAVGRPSTVEGFADQIREWFGEPRSAEDKPLSGSEVLRRLRDLGYRGGKSAVFDLFRRIKPAPVQPPVIRFEGLAGEFSQHDFGQRRVIYLGGGTEIVHFFASRLKYSRFMDVVLTPGERREPVFRGLLRAFQRFGGMPSKCVFDQMRTIIGRSVVGADGLLIPIWQPKFAQFTVECGFIPVACWPRRPNQKGSVENLVGFVKGSFFTGRRFQDRADLERQLEKWLQEVNFERPSDATGEIPAVRLGQERERLTACPHSPEQYALKESGVVRSTGRVAFGGYQYSVSSRFRGEVATPHVRAETVDVYIGSTLESTHLRLPENGRVSVLPQHAEEMFVYPRGRHYAKRQLLLDVAPVVEPYLTELVHRRPATWEPDVERMYDLYREIGHHAFIEVLGEAWAAHQVGAEYLVHHSRQIRLPGVAAPILAGVGAEVSR